MKSFWNNKRASKEAGDKKSNEAAGQSKRSEKGAGQSGPALAGGKPKHPQGNSQKKQEPRAQGPKTVRGAQSAVRPGNNSGLANKKSMPEVQFGPILREFLFSKELVDQTVNVTYHRNGDDTVITVSFKEVLPNGVSISDEKQLSFADYLANKKTLLKVKDDKTFFIGFATRLLQRLGVDVTSAKPNVSFRSVETFVLKHLSPVERVVIALLDSEYDQIDTTMIPEILEPTMGVIKTHYGGLVKRSEYLIRCINTDGPITDIEPPNWVLRGVGGISKAALLDACKLKPAQNISEEQRSALDAMAKNLLGVEDAHQVEEEKSKDKDDA